VRRRDDAGALFQEHPHARTCPICIDIARVAMRMHGEGRSIRDIVLAIDDAYAASHIFRTPTPWMPAVSQPR